MAEGKNPFGRRKEKNEKRANAWAQIANAYKIAKDNGALQDVTGRKNPMQILHTKGDVNGALFTASDEKYESEIKKPLQEAWDDIDGKKWTAKVKKVINAFENLKGPGGKGRSSSYYDPEFDI